MKSAKAPARCSPSASPAGLLHLSDVDGSVARHYRVDGLPELFLLDSRGVYRGVIRGAAPLAEILAAIRAIE